MFSLIEMLFPDWLREIIGFKEIFTFWTFFWRKDRDFVHRPRIFHGSYELDPGYNLEKANKSCMHVCETCQKKGLDSESFIFETEDMLDYTQESIRERSPPRKIYDSPFQSQAQINRSEFGEIHGHVYPDYRTTTACNLTVDPMPVGVRKSSPGNKGDGLSSETIKAVAIKDEMEQKEVFSGAMNSRGDAIHVPAEMVSEAAETSTKQSQSTQSEFPDFQLEQPVHRRHKRATSLYDSFGMGIDSLDDSSTSGNSFSIFGTGSVQHLPASPACPRRSSTEADGPSESQVLSRNYDWQQELLKSREELSPFIALMSAAQARTETSRQTATPRAESAQELRSISASDMRKIRSNYMRVVDNSFVPNRTRRRARSCMRKSSRRQQQRNFMTYEERQMNVLANVRFEEKFRSFAKVGQREATGITISCGNHLNWLRQAGLCRDEFTEMVSQFAFKEACGAKTVISIYEYKAMLERLSKLLGVDYYYTLRKLTSCGDPSETN